MRELRLYAKPVGDLDMQENLRRGVVLLLISIDNDF